MTPVGLVTVGQQWCTESMSPASRPSAPAARGRLRALLAVLAVAGLAWAGWHQRDAVAAFDWSIAPGTLAAAVLLLAVAPLLQAATFVAGFRALGVPASRRTALRVWARSFLLRYEPSGLVGFAYRVTARDRLGATTPQVLTVTAYEQLAAVLGGAVAAVVGGVVAGARPPWLALVLLGGLLGAAALVRPGTVHGRLERVLRERGVTLLPGRVVAAMVGTNVAGWAATGAGVVLLVHGLGAEVDGGLLVGAFALSWLLGVLVPLAPGGLGLRDGALVAALAASVGVGVATALALALRLVSFAAELVAVGVLEGAVLVADRVVRRRPGAQVAPAPTVRAVRDGDPRTVVVVPTYDEALTLPAFVERFAATGLDLLVVDDSSPDGTGEIAERLAATRPWMHVLHRREKDGLGMAYRAGFAWCLRQGYAVVGQMDCDLSHPPEKLAEMLSVLHDRDADLVLGNRYAPGGGTAGWSAARRALSRVGCAGSKLVLGLPYDDLSGGFKVWRASCLDDLGLEGMRSAGYAFQVETTQLAHLLGKRIEEVPFVFRERVAGESKMSLAVSVEGVKVTLALRRDARRRAAA